MSDSSEPKGPSTRDVTERCGLQITLPRLPPKTYVKQSKRSLQQRVKEHERPVQKGDVDTSAVAHHCWQNGHRVDWSEAKVLDSCPQLVLKVLFGVLAHTQTGGAHEQGQ